MTKDRRPIRVKRDGDRLAPYTQADLDVIRALTQWDPVEITIKQRRSLPQLQAYWAMLDKVVKATEAYPTAEHLHEALKWELGYITPITNFRGGISYMPDSVAFNKMRAPEFREYFAKAEKLIAEQFGIDVEELRRAA